MVPRPAVVISKAPLGLEGILLWTVMVTNATRAAWPGDIDIPEAEVRGLLIPSKVRTAKLAPVETAAATFMGKLDGPTLAQVLAHIRSHLPQ